MSRLVECLEDRRGEIERALLARVYSVGDPASSADPDYLDGLPAAVSTALGYGLAGLAGDAEAAGTIPPELLSQARRAARGGVRLDSVLRRYFAGYALLCDHAFEAARSLGVAQEADLQRVLQLESSLLDRLTAGVAEEYNREMDTRPRDVGGRRVDCVRRLLAGDTSDPAPLAYELDAWHVGVVASGPGASALLHDLAARHDRLLLLVCAGGETAWAWLGGSRRLEAAAWAADAGRPLSPDVALAFGEPAHGLAGWRQTHRQAAAAFPVALRRRGNVVRYADVALLVTSLQDELLAASLRDLYLAPILARPDGQVLCRTVSAYFSARRNVTATAAALKVSRPTVTSRLRVIEESIGRPPEACAAELETALRLEELQPTGPSGSADPKINFPHW